MARTKKVGSTGRFGSRYGKGVKKKFLSVEAEQKKKHVCPSCLKGKLSREAAGIWVCRKCGYKAAGRAYTPA
jgi:large subunit ribosomal protein L37Ae